MKHFSLIIRLVAMNFLEFAVWGAYLPSMGNYLAKVGLAENIGSFYIVQGLVAIFMPGLLGVVADRWIPAQRLLGICHFLAAAFMAMAGYVGMQGGADVSMPLIFTCYTLSVTFYMPTLALSNSVVFNALSQAGLDTVKAFPPIRVFGTIGFICMMWFVDLMGLQSTYGQFFASATVSLILGVYALTLPNCPISKGESIRLSEALGLQAFSLLKQRQMTIFFLFSMLLGVSLQITDAYANLFISSFAEIKAFSETFAVQHANIIISISQISETLCLFLLPFALKRLGIRRVMMIAMVAWVFRFGLFGLGNPGDGVWMFLLSCIVYGVAFDFFYIAGSLFVEQNAAPENRSSAQGLFMIVTSGIGASVGTLGAQYVVNRFVYSQTDVLAQWEGWRTSWFIFAGYATVVLLLFVLSFREQRVRTGI